MNKYLMKTIDYKKWKIEIYQLFALKRFEVICYSPTGKSIDYSEKAMRCWIGEEFALKDAQDFINLLISEQNFAFISLKSNDYFEFEKTEPLDYLLFTTRKVS